VSLFCCAGPNFHPRQLTSHSRLCGTGLVSGRRRAVRALPVYTVASETGFPIMGSCWNFYLAPVVALRLETLRGLCTSLTTLMHVTSLHCCHMVYHRSTVTGITLATTSVAITPILVVKHSIQSIFEVPVFLPCDNCQDDHFLITSGWSSVVLRAPIIPSHFSCGLGWELMAGLSRPTCKRLQYPLSKTHPPRT
jgi:hypothetical protein